MSWSWQKTSLRFRLIISTALATSAILALLAVTLYFSMNSALLDEFDDALSIKAQALAALTEIHDDHFVFEGEPGRMPEFADPADPQYFQIILPNGQVLVRSTSLAGSDLRRHLLPDAQRSLFITLPSGRTGRMVVHQFRPRFEHDEGGHEEKDRAHGGNPMPTGVLAPGDATVLVARSIRTLDATSRSLRMRLIGLGLTAVVTCVLLMTVIVGRGMHPVSDLARQISAIDEQSLCERVQLPGAVPELGPVVARLNDLLHRLDCAMERERAFSADVAHELRTPLSGIQTALEVCSSRSRTPEQYQHAINECLKVTRQMSVMVENLLVLARVESGQVSIINRPVDLQSILIEAWVSHAPRAAARNMQIEWNLPDDMSIETDPEKLGLILRNLFDNAVSYTDRGGTIRISAAASRDSLHLRIANSGCDFSGEELDSLFERFWRQDKARNNNTGHHGLGLALCRRVARVLGARIAAHVPRAGWLEIELVLPRLQAAPEPIAMAI